MKERNVRHNTETSTGTQPEVYPSVYLPDAEGLHD